MSLANKPVYPIYNDDGACSLIDYNKDEKVQSGITYKQWLVGMLAGNPAMFYNASDAKFDIITAIKINRIADAIIKELDEE